MNKVAKDRELYLENYWLKNKRAIDKGKNGPNFAWVIPAAQRRKADAADMVNELRRQGVEVHTADAAFKAGSVDVAAGDYVIRGDQPYRTLADMYFSVQNYPDGQSAPLRRYRLDDAVYAQRQAEQRSTDKSILEKPMTLLTADAKAAGGVDGCGRHAGGRAHQRQRPDDVPLQEQGRQDAGGRGGFRPQRPQTPRRRLHHPQRRPRRSWSRSSRIWDSPAGPSRPRPPVKTHELTMPRIGYVHSWSRTQDEGWVRAALDHYGVPYTYFADQKLQGRQPAREVRRDHLPARGRHVGIA